MTIDHARNKKLFGIKSSCWEKKEHQGLIPVSQKIAKRLNSIRGTRRFTKPSQTNGYLVI